MYIIGNDKSSQSLNCYQQKNLVFIVYLITFTNEEKIEYLNNYNYGKAKQLYNRIHDLFTNYKIIQKKNKKKLDKNYCKTTS